MHPHQSLIHSHKHKHIQDAPPTSLSEDTKDINSPTDKAEIRHIDMVNQLPQLLLGLFSEQQRGEAVNPIKE